MVPDKNEILKPFMIDLKPSINFWHDFKSNQLAGMWLFLGQDVPYRSYIPLFFNL